SVLRAVDRDLGRILAWRLGTPLLEPEQWSSVIERVAPASWRESVWTAIEHYGADHRARWLVTAVAYAARFRHLAAEPALDAIEPQTGAPVLLSSERGLPAAVPEDPPDATEAPI